MKMSNVPSASILSALLTRLPRRAPLYTHLGRAGCRYTLIAYMLVLTVGIVCSRPLHPRPPQASVSLLLIPFPGSTS
jgi:hypothetical protein